MTSASSSPKQQVIKQSEKQEQEEEEVVDSGVAETGIRVSEEKIKQEKQEEEKKEEEKEEEKKEEEKKEEDLMEEDDSMPTSSSSVSSTTVFQIRLKQSQSNLLYKMSVPELCRNFSATAWCAKLNAIACASETCARIPSSCAHPPFWIPIHIVNPERPTESTVFNVTADSPRDSVQFIEWSPTSCSRALLVANFHGRITIWTQPSKSSIYLAKDSSCWQCEHEWRQDIAVVTKWMSGISPV
ncbi:Mediator of rna polymerase ii transcription subunit [Thalictrum thalictroides]|uniref:Mediator of rna polymerase ii transcription subunit n=1 Tax=Thalictrum thalictroides TaxID=46969 RepID=A0A7J6V1I0_THATH|nr:Mediator of rna polymerase ii transcription subunit [Thalictrum thalictroides]